MNFNNRTYDILCWIQRIFLPALGTLYFALSGIWGFPYGEQIVGTVTAIVTFLGVILGISDYNYNKPYQIDTDTYIDDEEVKAEEVKE